MIADRLRATAPPATPETRPPPFAINWALFLDVDGTLLEVAPVPDAVQVDPALKSLLRDLRGALGGALALVTGRSVATIDRLFAPERLPTAGQHGVEWRDAGGNRHAAGASSPPLRSAAARLQRAVRAEPDLLVEDKGLSLAVHFRRTPELAGAAYDAALAAARVLGSGYELQPGRMVFEIKPSGHDKGKAIEAFMREAPFRNCVPVFVGDDLSDESGFALVNRLGGHSIKVGRGETAARWRMADARAVRAWLGTYLDFLQQS